MLTLAQVVKKIKTEVLNEWSRVFVCEYGINCWLYRFCGCWTLEQSLNVHVYKIPQLRHHPYKAPPFVLFCLSYSSFYNTHTHTHTHTHAENTSKRKIFSKPHGLCQPQRSGFRTWGQQIAMQDSINSNTKNHSRHFVPRSWGVRTVVFMTHRPNIEWVCC